MKPVHNIFVAIIVIAFCLQACQESPTATADIGSSTGIDLSAKPNCEVDPSHPSCGDDDGEAEQSQYDFFFSGDIGGTSTGPGDASKGQIAGAINDLDTTFLNTAFGGDCFVAAPTLEMGSIALTLNGQGQIDAGSTFRAFGTDGSEVRYKLTMTGPVESGDWLPTATSVVRLNTWIVVHDSGKGKKIACEGNGAFDDATVTVTLVQ